MMSHIVLQHIYNCNSGAAVCVLEWRRFCGRVEREQWGEEEVSPCSCPKMKEASPDKNSQTWKRRVERKSGRVGKRKRSGRECELAVSVHLSGDLGLNSAHGGDEPFFPALSIFYTECLMSCANLQDLGQLVATGFSLPVKIGPQRAVRTPFEGSFECICCGTVALCVAWLKIECKRTFSFFQ